MPRKPKEKTADEALTEAISAVVQAYEYGPDLGILTDYIVIAAFQGFEADGDDETHIMAHPRDGSLPVYRIMGLVDYAQAHERGIVAAACSDDDE